MPGSQKIRHPFFIVTFWDTDSLLSIEGIAHFNYYNSVLSVIMPIRYGKDGMKYGTYDVPHHY